MFLFSFVSTYFQNPLLIISLTQWFKSVLFSFRTFVTFPAFLLLLTFSFILLWSEQILSMISILNLLRLVLQPNFVIHPGECSLCAWEECVLFCWVESCGQLLGLLALSSCLSLLFLYWFYVRVICWLLKAGTEVSYYYSISISFFFRSVYIYLLYIFRCCDVSCMCIYQCYIFLLNWSFYHYVMTFFVSRDSFCLQIHFVWYKLAILAFFCYHLRGISFSIPSRLASVYLWI